MKVRFSSSWSGHNVILMKIKISVGRELNFTAVYYFNDFSSFSSTIFVNVYEREDLYIKIIKFFLIVMCYCRQVYYYCSYKQRNMANMNFLILRAGSYGYRLSLIRQDYMINCLLTPDLHHIVSKKFDIGFEKFDNLYENSNLIWPLKLQNLYSHILCNFMILNNTY